MLNTSHIGLGLIKRFEGFRAKPYLCPAGCRTIGYGHVIQSDETFSVLTETEAERLLQCDLKRYETIISLYVTVPLTQNQFDALVSFVYNVGIAAFLSSTLLKCVNNGRHELVCKEFGKWVYCNRKVLSGLKERREAEALLYSKKIDK